MWVLKRSGPVLGLPCRSIGISAYIVLMGLRLMDLCTSILTHIAELSCNVINDNTNTEALHWPFSVMALAQSTNASRQQMTFVN